MSKTIGFFGDSFCEYVIKPHTVFFGYKTYLKLLAEHYDCKIVHTGLGGSSIADTCLLQFTEPLPDICIFLWTDHARLFNRQIRKINMTTSRKFHLSNRAIWKAADDFYTHLYDDQYHKFICSSMLLNFDMNVISKFPNTKFIHLWGFGTPRSWTDDGFKQDQISYLHRWKHGVEIRPPIASLVLENIKLDAWSRMHEIANHIDSPENNIRVFNTIKYAIDNYQSGSLVTGYI